MSPFFGLAFVNSEMYIKWNESQSSCVKLLTVGSANYTVLANASRTCGPVGEWKRRIAEEMSAVFFQAGLDWVKNENETIEIVTEEGTFEVEVSEGDSTSWTVDHDFPLYLGEETEHARTLSSTGVSVFYNEDFVDTSREAQYMVKDLREHGHDVMTVSHVGDSDRDGTIVVPELERADLYEMMGEDERDFLRQYVEGGGELVVSCANRFAMSLVNGLFGWGIVEKYAEGPAHKADVTGRAAKFAEAPDTLYYRNAICSVGRESRYPEGSNLVYVDTVGDIWVGMFPYGSGGVTVLAFDWYDGERGSWPELLSLAVESSGRVARTHSAGIYVTATPKAGETTMATAIVKYGSIGQEKELRIYLKAVGSPVEVEMAEALDVNHMRDAVDGAAQENMTLAEIEVLNKGDFPVILHTRVTKLHGDGVEAFYSFRTEAEMVPRSGAGEKLDLVGDTNFARVTLPFDFPFFGAQHGTAYVAVDGYVTFSEPTNAAPVLRLGQKEMPNNFVAAFFADLVADDESEIAVHEGELATRGVLITWSRMRLFKSNTRVDFALELRSDGTMTVRHESVPEAMSMKGLVGIEDEEGEMALEGSAGGEFRPWITVEAEQKEVEPGLKGEVKVTLDGGVMEAMREKALRAELQVDILDSGKSVLTTRLVEVRFHNFYCQDLDKEYCERNAKNCAEVKEECAATCGMCADKGPEDPPKEPVDPPVDQPCDAPEEDSGLVAVMCEAIVAQCPGYCSNPTTTLPPTPAPTETTPAPKPCKDLDGPKVCRRKAAKCSKKSVYKNCQKTCGKCT